jgi:hypothetical protein
MTKSVANGYAQVLGSWQASYDTVAIDAPKKETKRPQMLKRAPPEARPAASLGSHDAAPPRKASFGTLAPALPQAPVVLVGWMLGITNGPMRAYTSFGIP